MALLKANTGIGTTNPTAALHVFGDSIFTGIITAQSFSGTATTAITAGYASTAGVSTSVIGGIVSVSQLNVSGVSTFGGNVYLGSNDTLYFGDSNEFFIYRYAGLPNNKTVIYNSNGEINVTSVGGLTIDNGSYSYALFNGQGTALYHTATDIPAVTLRYNTTTTGTEFYKDITIKNAGGTEYFVVKTGGGSYSSNQTLVGIGTTNPTAALHVFGNSIYTGIITAQSFSGSFSGTATTAITAGYTNTAGIATYATTSGISTSVRGGIGSITQLQVTGVSTSVGGFTSGIGVTNPVQIAVSGNVLTFTVLGVGSTSLILY